MPGRYHESGEQHSDPDSCSEFEPHCALPRYLRLSAVQSGSRSQRATEISLIHKAPPKRLDFIAAGDGL